MEKEFFYRNAKIVAKSLIGKVIVRKIGNTSFKARIIETEAYFNENDPASWARYGKRKDNGMMWEEGGTILVKNVHKYVMFNIVTGKKNKPQAVLIRGAKPLNFEARMSGPGLLTSSLKINKSFNGKSIFDTKEIQIIDDGFKFRKNNIKSSKRIGVKSDLKEDLRFYVKDL